MAKNEDKANDSKQEEAGPGTERQSDTAYRQSATG